MEPRRRRKVRKRRDNTCEWDPRWKGSLQFWFGLRSLEQVNSMLHPPRSPPQSPCAVPFAASVAMSAIAQTTKNRFPSRTRQETKIQPIQRRSLRKFTKSPPYIDVLRHLARPAWPCYEYLWIAAFRNLPLEPAESHTAEIILTFLRGTWRDATRKIVERQATESFWSSPAGTCPNGNHKHHSQAHPMETCPNVSHTNNLNN
jgi:hypothetical protein